MSWLNMNCVYIPRRSAAWLSGITTRSSCFAPYLAILLRRCFDCTLADWPRALYLFLPVLQMILLSGCTTPNYLPSHDAIGVNPYGARINVTHTTGKITGELIALDSAGMVLLRDDSSTCVWINTADVKRYTVRYAKPVHYGWTIPFVLVAPWIHGFYTVFTVPLHLLVTISVTAGGECEFTYSDKNMTFEKLKMFTRYPQGIPEGVSLADIKR